MDSTSPTTATTSGRPPTENMRAVMAAGHDRLGHLTRSQIDELDRMHAAGLGIPPAVRQAVETMLSFSIALGYNAQGFPTPAQHRAALGLT